MENALSRYIRLWESMLLYNDNEMDPRKLVLYLLAGSLIAGPIVSLALRLPTLQAAVAFIACALVVHVCAYIYLMLGASTRASKVEEFLPDFLSLVSSNIRAGLTPDRALIVSARPDFGPLAKSVLDAGKHSITGMSLDQVMGKINVRIKSDMLEKTIRLVVEGLHSGGDMAELLEKTAYDLRKFRSVRKEVSSIILNYVLFIMAAVTFGAPLLYGLASFLVEIMTKIRGKVAAESADMSNMGAQVSIFKGKLSLSADAVLLFSSVSIVITVLFGCMAVGVMASGKRVDGLKYFPFLLLVSLGLFFGIRLALGSVLGSIMQGT
jgi:archaeal flagellar protein FlaJ